MHWNMTNVSSGMPLGIIVSIVIPYRKALSKPPITAPNGLPDLHESGAERPAIPESWTHRILTTPTMNIVCMMTLSTFFWRTSPP